MSIRVKSIQPLQNDSADNFAMIPFYFNSIGQLRIVDSYCTKNIYAKGIKVSVNNNNTILINENSGNLYTVSLYITDSGFNIDSSSCYTFTRSGPINSYGLYKKLSWSYNSKYTSSMGAQSSQKDEILSVTDLNGQTQIQCFLGSETSQTPWNGKAVGGYIYIEQQ
jgi:hypothetical protein